jgi:L-aspartate oxidase
VQRSKTHDTPRPIIVGTGLAGLWTAWRLAHEGRAAVLLTKGTLADSASAWAQGGIAAAFGPGDSPALHAADTLAAGDGLGDPEAFRVLTTEGPDRIRQLITLGATFDVWPDRTLRLGLEGAHSRPRILHAGGDRTGAMLVACLAQIVSCHPLIEIFEHTEVTRLLLARERVAGVVAVHGASPFTLAGPVVLATGGVGQLFAVTTNPLPATGDGWALAHHAGAELRDVEFLQFHPTAVKLPGVNPAPLISEAVRGAGATLVDATGRRFVFDADPRGELASRDIVAQAVAAVDRAGGGAWLDARHVADFATQFPGVTAMLARHGLDPTRHLIPVTPAMHYAMGGIRTDLDGRTSRNGLWAVGEVASTGVHGANRLASNSLLEAMVFADRAARALVATRSHAPRSTLAAVAGPWDSNADGAYETARSAMRRVMSEDVGVQRSEASLLDAERALAALVATTPEAAWRTRNQLLVAQLIAHAALRRRESRGGHTRVDFPERVPA